MSIQSGCFCIMTTENFTTPMVARVDGVWRPVRGQIIQRNKRLIARYILNGKIFEEHLPGNWRNFSLTTTFGQLKNFAIKYNLHDMDDAIHYRNEEEQIAIENARGAQPGRLAPPTTWRPRRRTIAQRWTVQEVAAASIIDPNRIP